MLLQTMAAYANVGFVEKHNFPSWFPTLLPLFSKITVPFRKFWVPSGHMEAMCMWIGE
jgi:hypothetical protein